MGQPVPELVPVLVMHCPVPVLAICVFAYLHIYIFRFRSYLVTGVGRILDTKGGFMHFLEA